MTDTIQQRIDAVQHWYHQIEMPNGATTPGINRSKATLEIYDALGFPADLTGKRVLDIGCADGYFSFVAERRGAAEIVAIDYRLPTASGFSVAADLLGSKVRHVVANVYDLVPETLGQFDFIIFAGLLYHLRNPMLAVDRVRALARDDALVLVETHTIDATFRAKLAEAGLPQDRLDEIVGLPMWDFYHRDALNGDFSNKWAPTLAGLHHLCMEAQLRPIATQGFGSRGAILCRAVVDPELEFHRVVDASDGVDRP